MHAAQMIRLYIKNETVSVCIIMKMYKRYKVDRIMLFCAEMTLIIIPKLVYDQAWITF